MTSHAQQQRLSKSNPEDESILTKRMRNAEAAKRCREKKKKEEIARFHELENKIVDLRERVDTLKNQNEFISNEKEKLQTKHNFLSNLVSKLKNELHRQKEYIIKLEANMIAIKMSGRVAPITAFNPMRMNNYVGMPFACNDNDNHHHHPHTHASSLPSLPNFQSSNFQSLESILEECRVTDRNARNTDTTSLFQTSSDNNVDLEPMDVYNG